MMDSSFEITIPTFLNVHLFWIVPIKDFIIRSAMVKVMKAHMPRRIRDADEAYVDKMVAVNIGDLWARAVIQDIIQTCDEDTKYVCWLPDYGVVQVVTYVFYLPEELKKCPDLAKQASLYNVVNLTQDLILGSNGYDLKLKETTEDIPGVSRASLNCLEDAKKIFFSPIGEDEYNLYGDVVCVYGENARESLTQHLIDKNLVTTDEYTFNSIDVRRSDFKKKYFTHSSNWQRPLELPEKEKLDSIIFNKDKNISMDFFERSPLDDWSNGY